MSGRFVFRDVDNGDTSWIAEARCAGLDPKTMFPEQKAGVDINAAIATAKAVCAGCPVVEACRDYALRNGEKHGVWGGLSEPEMRKLRRRLRAEGKLPPASTSSATPVRHGEPHQYMRCRRQNGTACNACKAQHRIDVAMECEARGVTRREAKRAAS